MKDNQRTKSSKSPIRKQLTKKMINYFDQLETAQAVERSSSRKRSDSKNNNQSRSVYEVESGIEYYEDVGLRKKKLQDLKYLMKNLESRKPASLEVAAFLWKDVEDRTSAVTPKYVGTHCPDAFVVGYGLDYAERYRNLPYLGILKPEVYS